jgi:hypothetical protein
MRLLRCLAELPGELLGARGRFSWLARVSFPQAVAIQLAGLFMVGCLYAGLRYIPRLRYTDMLERTYGDASTMVSPELVTVRKETEDLKRRAADIRGLVVAPGDVGDLMETLSSLCADSGIRFESLRRSGDISGGASGRVTLVLTVNGDFAGIVRFLRNAESRVRLASAREVHVSTQGQETGSLAARVVFGVMVQGEWERGA